MEKKYVKHIRGCFKGELGFFGVETKLAFFFFLLSITVFAVMSKNFLFNFPYWGSDLLDQVVGLAFTGSTQ